MKEIGVHNISVTFFAPKQKDQKWHYGLRVAVCRDTWRSWVVGTWSPGRTLPFGLLLRLFGNFPNNSNTASVGEKSG